MWIQIDAVVVVEMFLVAVVVCTCQSGSPPDLHNLELHGFNIALVPQCMVDLVEHAIRDGSSLGPEICWGVFLSGVAHHISCQQQISLPRRLETTKGEIDLLDQLWDELHLNTLHSDALEKGFLSWIIRIGSLLDIPP